MSRFAKAIERLLARPKDFTWNELQTILTHLGYREISRSGSRRKFIHAAAESIISLHEPHPQPFLKRYALDYVIDELRKQNLI
ncbi:MAG TPA: type II toxin-antitoxin system HicA family toxin [Cyclobacteriaceae bacterium]|nr:type II toxin-antitoxin system HicA family toxin [Cyclobacteriaceae bacterium]